MTMRKKRSFISVAMIIVLLFALLPATAFGASAPWAPNTAYKVGDLATYGGSTYSCIQAHTSLTGWEPPNVPALWALQTGTGGDTQPPTAPTNLTSSAVTSTSVNLSWTASTDNTGVTGYDIYNGTARAGSSTTPSFTVNGLTANTSYTFTVKAKDAAGNISAASNAVTVKTGVGSDTTPPAAPANLASPSKTGTTVALTWNASTDNVGVTGYDIYQGTAIAGSTAGTSFTVTGLTASTAYGFTVKAKDAAGNASPASNAVSVTTNASGVAVAAAPWAPNTAYKVGDLVTYGGSTYKCLQAHTSLTGWEPPNVPALWALQTGTGGDTQPPTAPTNLASSAVTSTSVNLSWTASTDNTGVTGYDIYNGTARAGSSTTPSFTVNGLTANTSYTFTVKAKDAAGNISAASNAVTVKTGASSDTTPPSAPANLASTGKTDTTVSLTWTAATDNVGVTGYDIYKGTAVAGSAAGTSFTVTGLTASTAYSFTVKAKDAAGNVSAASSALSVTTNPSTGGGGGYKIVAYYPEWAVYGRGYPVPQIDATKITHINYAFADICWNGTHGNPDPSGPNPQTWSCQDEKGTINVPNGSIVQGDPWADTGISYPGDTWDMPIKGSFNQLIKLKQSNPRLKTIISVGGWSWSNRFSDVAADPATRKNFADSAVNFLRKYSFDGVDLDWEYPVGGGLSGNSVRPADKTNYTLLLQDIRKALDAAGTADGKRYLLTIASGASQSYISNTELSKIAATVDWINIMTYDFHGGFDPSSGNNAPLYFDPNDNSPNKSTYHVDAAVTSYLQAGVPASKLVLGEPLYGRGWSGCANVNNGLYKPCSGPATVGTWDKGVFDFTDLENNYINKNGYTRYWNDTAKVPYLFNPSNGTFITYDDAQSIRLKDDYLKSKGLGGAMIWELSSDRNHTLINQIYADLPR